MINDDRTIDEFYRDLAAAGYNIKSLDDLMPSNVDIKKAIPVLSEYLPKIEHRNTKEFIARVLTDKRAKSAAPVILAEFKRQAKNVHSNNVAIVLANALSQTADDSIFEDIAKTALDKSYGDNRFMLAAALGNMKNPLAIDVLMELLKEYIFHYQALPSLKKLKAIRARTEIERLLCSKDKKIRKKAEALLTYFNKLEIPRDQSEEMKQNEKGRAFIARLRNEINSDVSTDMPEPDDDQTEDIISIIYELREKGFRIRRLNEIIHDIDKRIEAIPILIEWLSRTKDESTRREIAIVLRIIINVENRLDSQKIHIARLLIPEFIKSARRFPSGGATRELARAINVSANGKNELFNDIKIIALDKRLGWNRKFFTTVIASMSNPERADVLLDMLKEDDLAQNAISGLKYIKVEKAIPEIERYLDHGNAWIRQAAQEAIDEIKKAAAKKNERKRKKPAKKK